MFRITAYTRSYLGKDTSRFPLRMSLFGQNVRKILWLVPLYGSTLSWILVDSFLRYLPLPQRNVFDVDADQTGTLLTIKLILVSHGIWWIVKSDRLNVYKTLQVATVGGAYLLENCKSQIKNADVRICFLINSFTSDNVLSHMAYSRIYTYLNYGCGHWTQILILVV